MKRFRKRIVSRKQWKSRLLTSKSNENNYNPIRDIEYSATGKDLLNNHDNHSANI